MMGNRLGQSSLLPHAFAVARNSPPRCIAKLYPFERLASEPGGLRLAHPVEHEAIEDKLPPGNSAGKGVELSAVADGAKELNRVAGNPAVKGLALPNSMLNKDYVFEPAFEPACPSSAARHVYGSTRWRWCDSTLRSTNDDERICA